MIPMFHIIIDGTYIFSLQTQVDHTTLWPCVLCTGNFYRYA
jgi:hypothetical protein